MKRVPRFLPLFSYSYVGSSLFVLLCSIFCFSLVDCFPQYISLLPNGGAFPALGHENGIGGGGLSCFGKDVVSLTARSSSSPIRKHIWTEELCNADSDGDGESNGLELGDPCCAWASSLKSGGNFLRSKESISDPSDPLDISGSKFPSEEECAVVRKTAGAALHNSSRHNRFNVESVWSDAELSADAAQLYGDSVGLVAFLRLVAISALFVASIRFDRNRVLSNETVAVIALGAYVWSDIGSSMLHAVLDNPKVRAWHRFPIIDIARHAKVFQAHHTSPRTITVVPWFSYLSDTHDLILIQGCITLATCSYLSRRGVSVENGGKKAKCGVRISRCIALFSICCAFFHHLSLASHRWSHEISESVGIFPYILQFFGIVMSASHHAVHHILFDRNFCFLGGWSDFGINASFMIFPRRNAYLWCATWFAWTIAPFACAVYAQRNSGKLLKWRRSLTALKMRSPIRYMAPIILLGFLLLAVSNNATSTALPRVMERTFASPASTSRIELKRKASPLNDSPNNSHGVYTADDVQIHRLKNDVWIVIENNVYDVTGWLDHHPGGSEIILEYAGYDATEGFAAQSHSDAAMKLLETYRVGILKGEAVKPPEEYVDDEPPEHSRDGIWADYNDAYGCSGSGTVSRKLQHALDADPCMGALGNGAGDWCYTGRDVSFVGESRKPFNKKKYSELAARQITDLRKLAPDELFQTPVEHYYIRTAIPQSLHYRFDSNGHVAWNITIEGLKPKPFNISVASLHQRGHHMGQYVQECSGNTRFWRMGLKSAGNFTKGVRLIDLISEWSSLRSKLQTHVLVEGYDKHIKSGGGRKGAAWIFSMEQVRKTGMFFALEQNGASLAHDHGFPVRLVVPNWYGCSHIKWVTFVSFVDGARTRPTSQMLEFRSRVHMKKAPSRSALRWSARQGYSATAERIEIWKHKSEGKLAYKAVGLLWGGDKPTNALRIRFPPLRPNWEPVDHVNKQSYVGIWSQWCHNWILRDDEWAKYRASSKRRATQTSAECTVSLSMSGTDAMKRTVRLKRGRWGKNWYARKFRIDDEASSAPE